MAHPRHHHSDQHGHQHGSGRRLGRLTHVHSHDSADAVDSALESNAAGIRAVKVSLVALLATAAVQATVVAHTGSVALLADTIHNLADALTAVPLWIAFTVARRPPTRRYTYGYGRAEDLAGVVIVAVMTLSALVAGYESVVRLVHPQPVTHLGTLAAAGLVGFAGNEIVAIYRLRVGRRIGSAALVADGLHARTDGLASLSVVLSAAGVWTGFPRADALVGLAVTVAILVVLRQATRDIYRRLMDATDPQLVADIATTLRATPEVRDVDEVRLRWIGHRMRAEVGISADPELTLVQAHVLAHDAEHQLLHHIPRLDDALVHVGPAGDLGATHHAELAHHRSAD